VDARHAGPGTNADRGGDDSVACRGPGKIAHFVRSGFRHDLQALGVHEHYSVLCGDADQPHHGIGMPANLTRRNKFGVLLADRSAVGIDQAEPFE
jgi:hypothetical protein